MPHALNKSVDAVLARKTAPASAANALTNVSRDASNSSRMAAANAARAASSPNSRARPARLSSITPVSLAAVSVRSPPMRESSAWRSRR
jgi:hypothetical protein